MNCEMNSAQTHHWYVFSPSTSRNNPQNREAFDLN